MSQDSSPQSKSPSTTLDEHFASFASRVEKIDQAIDVNDPQSLITARGNLGEIIGELEKLHIDEVCPLALCDVACDFSDVADIL